MNHTTSRSILIDGKRTSVRLENHMWFSLKDIAKRENTDIHRICSVLSRMQSKKMTLTSKIRVFIMLYYKSAATEEGHAKAGHGDFEKTVARNSEVINEIDKNKRVEDCQSRFLGK